MHVFCVTRKTAAVPKYRNINVSLLRNLARLFCICTPKPCVARQACPWMPLPRLRRDCGMTFTARFSYLVTPKPCVARQVCPWKLLSRLWRDCGMTFTARFSYLVTPKPCVARQVCPWTPLSRLWRDCGMTTVDKKDHPNLDSFSQLTQSFVFVRTSSKTFLAV